MENNDLNILAEKLKAGDENAAEMLYDYFAPKIYSFYIVRILHKETAEDLTQDVFIKLIKKIHTFDPKKGDFAPWIWQVARNNLIDHYRNTAKRNLISFLPYLDAFPQGISKNENLFFDVNREIAQEIISTVREFTDDEKNIFSLYHLSGMTYKELSKITKKSEGSLRVAIFRLNKKIKKAFNEK